MNYYGPKEIQREGKHTGLYHYTCQNDDRVWAVGYCDPYEICPDCKDFGFATVEQRTCLKCKGTGLLLKDNPCPGHDSEEGACEHYRQYLISKVVIRGPKEEKWPKHKCAIAECDQEGDYLIDIPGHMGKHFEVCEIHATTDAAGALIGPIGEIWSS